MECLECICCCFNFQQQQPPTRRIVVNNSSRRSAVKNRLVTKYKKQDFVIVSDADRYQKKVKAYCCPICTYYYTKILACGQCSNCVCIICFQKYDNRNIQSKKRMQCPFCNSKTSIFTDYELQPHSYFDPTNQGFFSKQDRIKADSQINIKPFQSVELRQQNLQNIEQQRQQRQQQQQQ